MKIQPSKRPSKISVPPRAHPLAKLVFCLMRDNACTYAEMEWVSGVLTSTLKSWRTHSQPGLATIEACLGALGWRLVPVPPLEALPPEQRDRLETLGLDFLSDDEALAVALACATSDPTPKWTENTPAPLAECRRPNPKALRKRLRRDEKRASQ